MSYTTFLSPAKLNLGLKITGKREDGYHLMKTIFCLIDLFDQIDFQVLPYKLLVFRSPAMTVAVAGIPARRGFPLKAC